MFARLRSLTKPQLAAGLTLLLGVSLTGVGFWLLLEQTNGTTVASATSFISSNAPETASQSGQVQSIVVEIAGAVKQPGVYSMLPGERLAQLLDKAGGPSDTADLYFLQTTLNTAQKVNDGQKFYLPFLEERAAKEAPSASDKPAANSAAPAANSLISLNSGTVEELDTLPGIGQKRAEDIVANRPYTALDDLLTRKIVSQSVFDKIKPFLEL